MIFETELIILKSLFFRNNFRNKKGELELNMLIIWVLLIVLLVFIVVFIAKTAGKGFSIDLSSKT